jgi:hypothetical protein
MFSVTKIDIFIINLVKFQIVSEKNLKWTLFAGQK